VTPSVSHEIDGYHAPGAPSSPNLPAVLMVANPVGGLSWKTPVRLATTSALPACTATGSGRGKTLTANGPGALTVDGRAAAAGDRILVKDQGGVAAHADDGIYAVLDPGAGGRPWILVRALDLDGVGSSTEVVCGAAAIVQDGDSYSGLAFRLATLDPVVVDSTAQQWVQLAGGGGGGSPSGPAGGQLGGTYPNPDVRGIRESGGPTALSVGAIPDGSVLARSGAGLTGVPQRPAVAAGTQTGSTGTVVFSNSNGVSFGMAGNVVTASVVPPAQSLSVSAGTSSAAVGQVVLSNSNNLSFGLNGSTITGSASFPAQTAQTQNVVVPAAGTQTATSGTVVFANSNGISFGMSGSSQITASYTVPTVPAQTAQTLGAYGLGNTAGQSSSSTLDARSLSLSGAGLASVGLSGGAVVVSVTAPAQTVQTQGVVAPAAGTQTATSGTVVFANSNGISFGMSGSSQVTASYTVPNVPAQSVQTQGVVVAAAGTQTATTGTVVFSNSNGISFGMSNSSVVTASYTVPNVPAQTNQTLGLYGVGQTTGQSSSTTLDARTLSVSGLGAVSAGYSAGALVISAPNTVAQTNQSAGLYALGNTTGQSSSTTVDARSMSLVGGGIVSVGYSGGSIQISAPPPGAGNVNVSAGTASNNATQVVFSNSNGVSFGLNGSTVTASVATSLTNVNVSAGTTSNNLSAVVFSNSNGMSFGLNGSTVTGSYTVPTQSAQTLGAYGVGNTTGQSSSTTVDARTVSVSGLGAASVGYSGGALVVSVPNVVAQTNQTAGLYALGNTTQNSSTTLDARSLSLNGGGIVTVGYSNGSIQVSATTAQSAQTVGAYGLGQTAGQSSSSTLDARSLSFSGLGAVSVGLSAGAVVVSAPNTVAQTVQTVGGYAVGNTTGQSSSSTLDARSVSFSGAGAASVGYSGGSVVVSVPAVVAQTAQTVGLYGVGNTTQNSSTTLDARTLSFGGRGDITVGYSNGTVQISGNQTAQTQNVVVPSAGT